MLNFLVYTSAPAQVPENTIAIFAVNAGWNDFGYNFSACMRANVGGKVLKDYSINVLPISNDEPKGNLSHWIAHLMAVKNNTEQPRLNQELPYYVSVFSTVSCYRDLANTLTKDEYNDLLLAVGEINHLRFTGVITPIVYEKIIGFDQFKSAVLRNSGTYEAFRFGYNSSNFLEPPADARIPFSYSTKLDGFISPHSVSFTYENHELISDRVHCLIGVNGVGKTRYLNDLVIGCLRQVNAGSQAGNQSNLYDDAGSQVNLFEAQHEDGGWRNIPVYSRVNFYSTDPHNILPRTSSFQGCFDYRYFDMGLAGEGSLSQFLADIIRSGDRIGGEDRFVLLKKIIQKVVPTAQLMLPVNDSLENGSKFVDRHNKHWIPIGAIRGGELRQLEILGSIDSSRDLAFGVGGSLITPLSSGQKMYLRFATHFLTTASKGMLILIDEPETHLHPNLITEFMNLLYLVLEATSSVAIVATHSAYVVREVSSHCVHVFQVSEDQAVKTEQVYLNTLGASVSSISNSVFGDSLVSSFTDRIARQIASSSEDPDKVIDMYKSTLSMDMLIKIRALIKG